MMIGFMFWVMADGVSKFVFGWSIVVVVFTCIVLVAIYFGVRNKNMIERHLIRDKILKQQEDLLKAKKNE